MNIRRAKKLIDGKVVLDDINLSIKENQIIGLVGRNGAGKTSLFRVIAGHYLLDEGAVLINGVDVAKNPDLKKDIFYIDEQYSFFAGSSLATLGEFYAINYPNFDRQGFIKLLEENDLDKNDAYRSMSKGMQGLFKMILAIASNAKYLFLDEPFDGLDVIVRKNVTRLFLRHLADSNQSVMISSHNLQDLEAIIDRSVLLKDKTIRQDILLEDFKEKARKIQLVLGEKEIPTWIKNHSRALRIEGRVLTLVFDDYNQEIVDKLKDLSPVLMEELPLSLEDFFEANLSKEKDYQLVV